MLEGEERAKANSRGEQKRKYALRVGGRTTSLPLGHHVLGNAPQCRGPHMQMTVGGNTKIREVSPSHREMQY